MKHHLRILSPTIAALALCVSVFAADSRHAAVQQSIEAYQRALIARGVTGSSVAGVYRGSETIAHSVMNSGLPGDTAITAKTIFPIWSMSKPITIVAMMILHERGRYALEDPVSKYLPYFADMTCKDKTGKVAKCQNPLKVVHLLTHRSGYGYYESGKGPSFLDSHENLDQFARALAAHPAEFEPGTDYIYGQNQAILGRLVEVLSGKEFFVFLKENLFDPLDMPDTKFELTAEDRKRFQILFKKPKPGDEARFDTGESSFTREHDELPYTPGTKAQYGGEGLVSTFEDYRHFCEMLLAQGTFRGKRILSPQSIATMTAVATPGGLIRSYNNGQDHGFSLWLLNEPVLDGTGAPKGLYGWSGYHNTHFWIDPKTGIYGLFLTRTYPFSWEIQKQFRSAVYRGLQSR